MHQVAGFTFPLLKSLDHCEMQTFIIFFFTKIPVSVTSSLVSMLQSNLGGVRREKEPNTWEQNSLKLQGILVDWPGMKKGF